MKSAQITCYNLDTPSTCTFEIARDFLDPFDDHNVAAAIDIPIGFSPPDGAASNALLPDGSYFECSCTANDNGDACASEGAAAHGECTGCGGGQWRSGGPANWALTVAPPRRLPRRCLFYSAGPARRQQVVRRRSGGQVRRMCGDWAISTCVGLPFWLGVVRARDATDGRKLLAFRSDRDKSVAS